MKSIIVYREHENITGGELTPAYAYTITPEELETIENMIGYYNRFNIEDLITRRPDWVADDFNKILAILENITTQEV